MQIFSSVSQTPKEHALLIGCRVVRSTSALVLGLPIAVGSYVLCFLPSPHGEAYATANLNQTARIGLLGAGIIASAGFICVLIYAPPMKEILWGLFTRKGLFISLCFCAVQGMVGAAALEYEEDGYGGTRHLDVVQAGLAGVVGSLLLQIAADIIRRVVKNAIQAVIVTNHRRVRTRPRRRAT